MSVSTIEPEVAPEVRKPAPGHDARGRFAAGNAGGPGNPFGRQVAAKRKVAMNAISDHEIHHLMRFLLERAMAGCMPAAKLVLEYTVGKPKATAEPDRMDVEEFALHQASNIGTDELDEVTGGMPVRVASVMAAAMVPAKEAKMGAMWKECEENYVADQAAQAAEDAAIQRGVDEAIRRYREDPEYRREWEEGAQRKPTLEEILGVSPSPNGGNGGAAPSPNGGNGGPSPSPNGENGGPSPSPNGANGGRKSRTGARTTVAS